MKKSLIIGIILLIICLGLTVFYEIRKNNFININEITNKGLKTEEKEVFLDATYVAGSITNDSDNGYYVMFGDGVQYIVYINKDKANKIAAYLLDNPEDDYHIEGVTKPIPSDMEENGKKFVKEWLDHNHNHEGEEVDHDHNITTDEFYKYFGYVYMDTTINNYLLVKIFIYITGIIGLLLITSFVLKKFDI